ncbi:FtsK/SpoIIIE domain-containing protein [Curtobacterium herbarum]|uniref:FtsK domain-containing protein n=1 Tax=Curtobacterium herbarum TaxID=150122 RepID=A0ABP4K6P6_9MICO|nr:FtsK/SpoIIIE domain-containing protein [Curtobacterium herbarum]MBM7474913.1 hypothetical protein [Curtobacterium herbarum]MCS6545558.1 FtsK/SpoIIIE domain-containing protein [Curtobacterium herbarum]
MEELLDNIVPVVIGLLVVIVVMTVGGRLLIGKGVRFLALWKLPAEEREAFSIKQELLEHPDVIELYAPTDRFQKRHDPEKKKRKQVHWLSPYPKAVKLANKRPRRESKKAVTLVRSQVHAAASCITVAALPDHEQPANAGPEHFSITLKLAGSAEAKVRNLAAVIKSQLGLHSLDPADAEDYSSVRFIAHRVAPDDRLISMKKTAAFLDEHPVSDDLASIPMAVKADGSVWSLGTHHTLVLGSTGSGKAGPLHAVIRQLAPAQAQGRVKLYGADPKHDELPHYESSSLFVDLAYGTAKIAEMIETVHTLMMTRLRSTKADIESGDLGRSRAYTPENPLIILIIDEILSLLLDLQGQRGMAKYITLLTQILALGRAPGVFVIAATQEADKELLGRMRGNFVNKIVLRQPSVYFNDLFLMDGGPAAAEGFDSTRIPAALKQNGYRTAGIGFVKEETGQPVRVRFAYSSDEDIIDVIMAHRAKGDGLRSALAAITAEPDEPLTEAYDDLDESFGFIEVPDEEDDKNDDELALPALD